jgi:hypothetical protein
VNHDLVVAPAEGGADENLVLDDDALRDIRQGLNRNVIADDYIPLQNAAMTDDAVIADLRTWPHDDVMADEAIIADHAALLNDGGKFYDSVDAYDGRLMYQNTSEEVGHPRRGAPVYGDK